MTYPLVVTIKNLQPKVKKLLSDQTRILYFGMTGRFSLPPLARLISDGANVCGVILPGGLSPQPRRLSPPPLHSVLPLAGGYLTPTIATLAWEHQLPLWQVDGLSSPAVLAHLTGLQPDLIAVACFPYIFPVALLDLPAFGCVNLHPSLLPQFRGPEPFFWIARADVRQSGVTLHSLSQKLDAGDIIAQTPIERPDGLSGAKLEQQAAEQGALLLSEAVARLERGQSLPRQPQDEATASYFPQPTPADCLIPTSWPARRAFNFLRGAEAWPLAIDLGERVVAIDTAISYNPTQTLAQPYQILGDELWVQFNPGVLRARVRGAA